MEKSICSSEARLARVSAQQERKAESPTREDSSRLPMWNWLKEQMQDGWFSRTSLRYCPPTADATSPHSFRCSLDGTSMSRMADGETRGSSQTPQGDTEWLGECLTLNTPEFPHFRGLSRSEGVVSSLWDILIHGGVPQKYYLKANYAEALIRRAERCGKALPPVMERTILDTLAASR